MSEATRISGHGMYLVGIDIPPGRYHCPEPGDGHWIRYPGGAADPIMERATGGPADVVIEPGDTAFETYVPAAWVCVEGYGRTPQRPGLGGPGPTPRRPEPHLRPVLDPTLPADLAEQLRSHPAIVANVRVKAPLPPAVPSDDGIGWFVVAVVTLCGGLTGLGQLVGEARMTTLVGLGVAVLGVALLAEFIASRRTSGRMEGTDVLDLAWELGDRYFVRGDFDAEARSLMNRTCAAVDQVMGAEVRLAGLLDEVGITVTVPEEEWQIAKALADASRLRGERRSGLSDLAAESHSALEPLDAALAEATESIEARIDALERYAREVESAERAYRLHRYVTTHTDRYQDLLASAAVDDAAVSRQLDRLLAEAGALDRLLRDDLRGTSQPDADTQGSSGRGEPSA